VGRVVQGQKPQRLLLQLLPSRPQSLSCRQCVTMETPLSECTISEQRAVMRFLWAEGIKPSVIHRRILVQYGDKCIGQKKVYEWVKSKAVPLHVMEALGGRGDTAPTHSRPRH
jgi:hypothetical protein